MVSERLHPVGRVFPGPIDAVVLTLIGVIQIIGSLGAQLISRDVVAALAVIVLPARAGTEGQALDGSELQEEVRLQAITLVVAVLAGVVDLCERVGHFGAEIPFVSQDIPIIIPAAFVVVHRKERSHRQERTHVVVVDTADGEAVPVVEGERYVLTELQDVAAVLLDEGEIRVHPEGLAVELRIGRITEGTGLGEVGETDGKAGDISAAQDVDGLVVNRSVVDRGLFQPVGTVPGTGLNLRVLLGNEGRPVILGSALGVIGQVVDFHVLLGVQRSDAVGVRVLPAIVTVEGHADLAGLTLLGGHEDDAVRGAGAVDGAGSRVLQDVDGFDIVRGKGSDVTARDAVDDIQRGRGTDGAHTADGHLVAFARLTGVLDDGHAGRLALQGAERIDRIGGGQFLAGDVDGGTGDQLLALGTVTHHDDFVEDFGVFIQDDGQALALHRRNGDGLIADAGNLQARAPVDGEYEGSVISRQRAVAVRSDLDDTGADDRLSGGVKDDATHLNDRSRLGSR